MLYLLLTQSTQNLNQTIFVNGTVFSTPTPFFTGKHIVLRLLVPQDAPLYYRWLQNPSFLAYKPYLRQLCPTLADLFAHLHFQSKLNPQTEIEVLVIHKNTQVPIGLLGLASIDTFNQKAEFSAGFVYGHGTHALLEAIHAGIFLSFSHLNLHKVVFYATATNQEVLKIMQRNGFIQEGYFKEEIQIAENKRADLYRFALFRQNWQETKFYKRLCRVAPLEN